MLKKILLATLMLPLSALAQSFPTPTFNSLTLQNPLTAANGGTGATSATGTGSVVLSNSPALTTPNLGTPSAVTLTNGTGLPISTGVSGLGTGVAAGLSNAATGSGSPVLATSPSIASPTITGAFNATGLVTLADHATQAANTILANGTGSVASPTALAVPSCSAVGSALTWVSGAGLACSTVMTQAKTGQFYADLGAHVDNLNDRIFVGALTPYSGNSNTVPPDWTGSSFVVGGVPAFGYLEQNGTLDVSAIKGQLGIVGVGRASDGTGGGTQATIPISSVVVNDNTTGAGAGTWNFYGTTVRTATATGVSTIGYEQDVENLGSAAPIFPSSMFTNGLTADLWLAAGGELANQTGAGYTFNNTSAAIAVLANNAGGYANVAYDKGIVFAANALNSNNIAIAMAPIQQLAWFNSSNQRTGSFTSTATTTAAGQQLILGTSGLVVDDMSGNVQFQVTNAVTGAADYIQTTASTTGNSPIIAAAGTDTNINLTLQGKGTGTVVLPQDDVLTYISTGGQSIPNSTTTTLTGWTKTFDRLNTNFNASTGTFTAPVTGFYHVDAGISYASGTAVATNDDYQVAVVANGTNICIGQTSSQQTTSATAHNANTGCDVSLTAGQTVVLQAFQNSGAAVALNTGAGVNYVSIHRIP